MFTPRKNNSCRPYSFPKPICLICQNCWSIDFLEMFKLSSSFPFNFNYRFIYAPFTLYIHPGKLPWQWKTNHLKMYLLLKVVIFRTVMLVCKGIYPNFSTFCAQKLNEGHPSNHLVDTNPIAPGMDPICYGRRFFSFCLLFLGEWAP